MTLAVANMRSVSKRQLLVFCSFGTETIGAMRSRGGKTISGVGCSFVVIDPTRICSFSEALSKEKRVKYVKSISKENNGKYPKLPKMR